jgi:dimethylglycine dehydrogenase
VNGPIAYTPDGSPLIGPAWGVRNLWLNEGHSFGITAAGGSGWQLAEWITEGEPGIDMMAVDPRRYGPYTSKRYVVRKNEETYRNVFVIHYPDEERADARPAKTSPIYDKLKRMGAVFGQRYGWERANWFAPMGVEPKDKWSFRRSNYFEHVGNEVKRLRRDVGVIDLTPFTKHEVTGPGAEAWMDGLVANKVPAKIGRIALCHALTQRGGIRSEFTITKIAEQHYYVVSAGAAERYDSDYLQQHLPADGCVTLRNITMSRGCFVVAGPRSRDVLSKLADVKLDNTSFPWLTSQVCEVGLATDVYLLRVNFVGALGWELHFPIEYAHHLFDAIFAAGAEFNIGMAGMRAMESLRLEKSYRMWGSDLTPDYTPFEAGLDRFVRMNKPAFIGKPALEAQLARGVPHRFVTFEVHDVNDADPLGNEPTRPMIRRTRTSGHKAPTCASKHFRPLRCCGARSPDTAAGSNNGASPSPSRAMTPLSSAGADTGWAPRFIWRKNTGSPTSRSWRRAGSAAATPAATPPSFARTICSTKVRRSTITR